MSSILHVIDSSATEVELQVLRLLRSRSTAYTHEIAAIDGPTRARVASWLECEVELTPRRLPAALHWAPQLSQWARMKDGVVYHAWGLEAAQICKARGATTTIVLSLVQPDRADDVARWLRARPSHVAVLAGSQVIRSRLLSRGVPPDRVVVVRGGVDLAAINTARKSNADAAVAGTSGPVILMDGPPSRAGGQFHGLWAVAIVAQIHRRLRVILPYSGTEADRLQRFIRQIRMEALLIHPPARASWPELLSAADVFLAPAVDDASVEAIGWAMAAGVPVVGTATRAITELIADKHNGLLCKPKEPRALASRLLTAIEDKELRRRVIETARGQAYEVFSVRAFIEHCEQVYRNVLEGRPAADGVRDNAVVA